MSYTFSRRNFMKYTALAAAAVAVSGSLTGCSNPNRPVGKTGDTLKPGSGICEATLLNSDGKKPIYDSATKTLTCNFKIVTKIELLEITDSHFQVDVTTVAGTKDRKSTRSTIIIIPLLHPVWAIPPTPKLKRTVSPRPL